MPCCGDARNAKKLDSARFPSSTTLDAAQVSAAYLQYVGKTRLAVIGGVTRKVYCFGGPGATAIVDHRDVASLLALPMLRRT